MKHLLKQCANVTALLLVLPAAACYWMARLLLPADQAFSGWSQAFSLLPGLSGSYLRRAFFKLVLADCGDDAFISFGTVISHSTAAIGSSVYVGAFCVLGDVTLEEDVLLGSHVSVMNGNRQHGIDRLDIPVREQPGEWPRITIGRDSWIGDRAIVMADVGRHCVIGAGSVVTRPIPDYAIAAGCPATIRGSRQSAEANHENGDPSAAQPLATS